MIASMLTGTVSACRRIWSISLFIARLPCGVIVYKYCGLRVIMPELRKLDVQTGDNLGVVKGFSDRFSPVYR